MPKSLLRCSRPSCMSTPVPSIADIPAADAPPGFHLLAKPSGSTCNIDCTYCFFLSKDALYPNEKHRMSEATLEAYIRQLLESHRTPQVTVAWQGGEPTLMKVEFFRRSVELVEKYRRPGPDRATHLSDQRHPARRRMVRLLQGTQLPGGLERRWAARAARYLPGRPPQDRAPSTASCRVGGSCAGTALNSIFSAPSTPPTRNTAAGSTASSATSWARSGCSSSPSSSAPPRRRCNSPTRAGARRSGGKRLLYTQTGNLVTERTVGAEQYGRFLVDVFEEWVRHDVGEVYVQLFDVTLEAFFGRHLLCIHAPTCGYGPALEYNGDLYSCDHFVEPRFKLGNIHQTHMLKLVASPEQRKFGEDKRDTLTAQCRGCKVRNWCNGGCPKDRFAISRDGEPGQNYLCAGLEHFFMHTGPTFADNGPIDSTGPRTGRTHGIDCRRRCQTRSLSALPLRQRREVSLLPRQPRGARRPDHTCALEHRSAESASHS